MTPSEFISIGGFTILVALVWETRMEISKLRDSLNAAISVMDAKMDTKIFELGTRIERHRDKAENDLIDSANELNARINKHVEDRKLHP